MSKDQQQIKFIRKLCSGKTEEEIEEAEETFREYLMLVKQICLRLDSGQPVDTEDSS